MIQIHQHFKGIALKQRLLVCALFLVVVVFSGGKAVSDENLNELSLADLLDLQVNVASLAPENILQAPGILTVITSQDIERNQCRDLIDVINMVPGLSIATDMFETGALVSRGLYGFEGRALIMVNGMQMNDNYFGTYVIDGGFPVHLIERIEIIRGPGSVIYGGAAELAVVNIITVPDTDSNKTFKTSARYGLLSNGEFGHRDVGLACAKSIGDFKLHLIGSVGQATKVVTSDRHDVLSTDVLFPSYKVNFHAAGSSDIALAFNGAMGNLLELKGVYQRHENNWHNVINGNSIGFVLDTVVTPDSVDTLQAPDTMVVERPVGGWASPGFSRGELFETFNTEVTANWDLFDAAAMISGVNFHYDNVWNNNVPKNHNLSTAHPTYRVKPIIMN